MHLNQPPVTEIGLPELPINLEFALGLDTPQSYLLVKDSSLPPVFLGRTNPHSDSQEAADTRL
ncbi:hypothetical protein O77CONTIG1_01554 [Leptolyngbya sp. O-77]|nr:hypothetical protein O77CONTIG1_01554 [Leptolyngbya sp. O-77]